MINSEYAWMLMKSSSFPHKQHIKLWRSAWFWCVKLQYLIIWKHHLYRWWRTGFLNLKWWQAFGFNCFMVIYFILLSYCFVCVIMSSQAQNNYFKQQWSIFLDTVPLRYLTENCINVCGGKTEFQNYHFSKTHLFSSGFFFPP